MKTKPTHGFALIALLLVLGCVSQTQDGGTQTPPPEDLPSESRIAPDREIEGTGGQEVDQPQSAEETADTEALEGTAGEQDKAENGQEGELEEELAKEPEQKPLQLQKIPPLPAFPD